MVVQIPAVFLVEFARGDDMPGHKDVMVLEVADDGGNGGLVLEGLGHAINKHICDSVQGRDHDNISPAPVGNQREDILDVPFAFQRTATNLDNFHLVHSSWLILVLLFGILY